MRHTFHELSAVAVALFVASITGCVTPAKSPVAAVKNETAPKLVPKSDKYDSVMIKAIQVRWHELLNTRGYLGGMKGSMILEFNVHANGNVSNVTVVESKIDPVLTELCKAAVKDVAPFAPWPDEMRKRIGKDERIVRFNFNFD